MADTINIKKTTVWQGATALLAIIVIILLITGNSSDNTAPDDNTGDQGTNVQAAQLVDENDAAIGSADAPLTIVEFSDFQCPFCRKGYGDAVAGIKENYVSDGTVRFVYKHLPLTNSHPMALKSAEASECAKEQGMFWKYHDKLFEEQNLLDSGSKDGQVTKTVEYETSDLKVWAEEIGLDTEQFNSCLDSGEMQSRVEEDAQTAISIGARSTPTFIIGTATVSGAQPFSVIQQVVEAELGN